MVAIELCRRGDEDPCDLVLFEPRAELGRGLAYSTRDPLHLLNVPVHSMSAIDADPGHLGRWLEQRGTPFDGNAFIPRQLYGDYLTETLASHLREHERRASVRVVPARVEAVRLDGAARPRLETQRGEEVAADQAVLALGNGPLRKPVAVAADLLDSGRYLASPWECDPTELAGDGETVLLIGSGLTMVDVALSIDAAASGVRMISVSRSGLLPRGHRPDQPAVVVPISVPTETRLPNLMIEFFTALTWSTNRGGDATDAVDSLRPVTQQIWQALPRSDRIWFLRHLRRLWEVHRHRMAPPVAARIEQLLGDGSLRMRQGMLDRLELDGSRVRAHSSSQSLPDGFSVDRVINCTGPEDDVSRGELEPYRQMLAEGVARADPLGLGLRVTTEGALFGAAGLHRSLHAIGPVRKGSLWESTAIPELRRQASELAEVVLGGERAWETAELPA